MQIIVNLTGTTQHNEEFFKELKAMETPFIKVEANAALHAQVAKAVDTIKGFYLTPEQKQNVIEEISRPPFFENWYPTPEDVDIDGTLKEFIKGNMTPKALQNLRTMLIKEAAFNKRNFK